MPAQAADVARLDLGSRFGQLLPSPAGGVWVRTDAGELIRIRPDGGVTRTRVEGELGRGVIGPDGQAWYSAGGRIVRADGEGVVSPLATADATFPLATGPDGRTIFASSQRGRFTLVAADGSVTAAPSGRRDCPGVTPEPLYMTFASDGARWMVDGCARLLRNGAELMRLPAHAYDLVPDAAGGVWMSIAGDRAVTLAHAHPDGSIDYLGPRTRRTFNHAVAPDGSVWIALGDCKLARVTADGATTTVPSPIPASQVAFDGAGEIWLKNGQRVARGLDGTCDDQAPRATVPKRLSQRALASGIRITFREPVLVRVNSIAAGIGEGPIDPWVLRRPGSFRYRLPKQRLRQLERAKRPSVRLYLHVEDREGNVETQEFRVLVRR